MAELPEPFIPYLVIININSAGRAFGAAFSESVAELATAAAAKGGMKVVRIEGDELVAQAADLPHGKVFPSGSAFTPLMSRQRADKIIELGEAAGTLTTPVAPKVDVATTPADTNGEGAGGAAEVGDEASAPVHVPASHADIIVGSLVLASENGDDGYWPAIVVELAPAEDPSDDLCGLSFRDFPGYDQQVRRRVEIALMPRVER